MTGSGWRSSSLSAGLALVRGVVLVAAPDGGQHTARQNAWAGMAASASRARARREAERAVELAAERAAARGAGGSAVSQA